MANAIPITDSGARGLYPIRTVSELTGVNAITLRAWEKRHGLVRPIRKESGHRLYTQEHIDLIASIRAGKPLNAAKAVAETTLTGIMGREAAYSGQTIEWDDALNSTMRLGPTKYEFGPLPFEASAHVPRGRK